jgi:hypothetical protein
MRIKFFALATAFIVFTIAVQAQDAPSTTRLESQHKPTSSMASHLAQYELNILKTLDSGNAAAQAQAVQTLRELEQMFPKYPFEQSLAPLEAKLKDEKADPIVRHLVALALDELHSDGGDSVIKDVAATCQDKGLQTLCNALLVKSTYK